MKRLTIETSHQTVQNNISIETAEMWEGALHVQGQSCFFCLFLFPPFWKNPP